jgi:septum formation protein
LIRVRSVQLLLASASPRRRELLAQLGLGFDVVSVQVDETQYAGESPQDYVSRLALTKARAGWRARGDLHVLGADTAVELDGSTLGKPADKAAAMAMLEALGGREHRVFTGVALVADGYQGQCSSCTAVRLRHISPQEREAYWRTGEPVDKAGAYAIQGKGAVFVEDLRGSYSGVVGLPLFETAQLLGKCGIRVL